MLPQNFWADTAGNLLTMFFEAMMGLFLLPLTAIVDNLADLFGQFFAR